MIKVKCNISPKFFLVSANHLKQPHISQDFTFSLRSTVNIPFHLILVEFLLCKECDYGFQEILNILYLSLSFELS